MRSARTHKVVGGMVRINKVYTRTGDGGKTSLVGGQSIEKNALRVECVGTVDELNCALGLARSANAQKPPSAQRDGLERLLQAVQQRLFDLGAALATPPGAEQDWTPRLSAEDTAWLERAIDTLNEDLPPLRSFVLPGGGLLNGFLHQARAVCRRAERVAVSLSGREALPEHCLPYLNRLSDLLFVLSRWCAAKLGEPEWLWEPGLALDDAWKTW